MRSASKSRLERTKQWNFAGVILSVVSVTIVYLNVMASFVLTASRNFFLDSRVLGNPYIDGLPVCSILNILGVILLCGMCKNMSPLAFLRGSKFKIQVEAAFDKLNTKS
jgi:hypothetical protein